MGWIYVKRGLPNLAIPLLEESVRKDSRNGSFAYHLGAAYSSAGQHEKAVQTLRTAEQLTLSPADRAAVKLLIGGAR